MYRRPTLHDPLGALEQSAVGRARRHLRRGDLRKAATALREACLIDERDAARWTQYGAILSRLGRVDDAAQALRHALWLRRAKGDDARARVTAALLGRLEAARAA